MIRVIYTDGSHDMVKPDMLDRLIFSGKVKKFQRANGWTTVGIDQVRGSGGSYNGPDRRKVRKVFSV